MVFKDWGIKTSKNPTKCLMVCNVGLLSGASEADMVIYFSKFGKIEKVCMIPGKSYAFISFYSVESAQQSILGISQNVDKNNVFGSLHLIYVENLPQVDNLCKDFENIPPGLIIVNDFISENEELLLLNCVQPTDIDNEAVMKHRSVKHFGYEFNYNNNNIDKNHPLSENIPKEFDFLENRFKEKGLSQVICWIPDQLTVNSYLPGQGIPPHVDTHSAFEDPILSLSLLSDVVMEFEKCDKSKKASVIVPRRSLMVISGESRYFWTHGITPRKSDVYMSSSGLSVKLREHRISCTFRKILKGGCTCKYQTVCDSFIEQNLKMPTSEGAVKIEQEYVHNVYEKISDHFSLTRHSPWPKVLDFVVSLKPGSILVDIGCGNGKYFNLNKNIFHFGGDTCSKLNEICKEHGEVLRFNCLSLPFCDNIADAIICIAVLHHLSNDQRRQKAIKEIYRILKTGGRALIYVWAKEQKSSNYINSKKIADEECYDNSYPHNQAPSSVAFITENDILPIHSNRTQFQHKDLLVPWNIRLKDTEETCHLRYYHVFEENELDKLCVELGAEILNSYYDDGNWCVEIKKL